ncbi:hypothetical protein [Burkholderia pseudomultivorans]|uniref:hypothetical protein n=1 Tax=Burkholderia pseudomultivorans TaxID=1207504 RepID=UPI000755EDC7|nr:hypothetical protein [Burkholderia pseudomultivorans]KVG63750.1 hypothetical protein WS80_21210 [Burkholderia pseudomultivorans]
MSRCFVIQPFDNGVFDRRFEDTFAPAIQAAGLEPYRVDRDPSAAVPIQNIEDGIRESAICLADISLDNPNVWFELGFAFASFKQVVMVCSNERTTKFPFDVQHRSIIKYATGSRRDFDQLEGAIKEKLEAYLAKENVVLSASGGTRLKGVEGLEPYEIMVLVTIGENLSDDNDGVSPYRIRNDMENAGYTKLAATLGMRALREKELIQTVSLYDEQVHEHYDAYTFTDKGWTWLFENRDQFALRRPEPPEISF